MKSNYWIGILTGFGLGCLFLLIPTFVSGFRNPAPVEAAPKSRFEVVDNYKGCDLLRWTNNQLSEYKYVLYCGKEK